MSNSIKLPLREVAKVSSVKLRLSETVWLLDGFIIEENVISLKKDELVLIENIKSFITTQIELIDTNHIKLKWYGDKVPKVQIFKRLVDEDYSTTPYAEVSWTPQEYIMPLDANGYVVKVIGGQNTGEGQEYLIGNSQDYDVTMNLQLPINEKHYYFDIAVYSEFRIEVNI